MSTTAQVLANQKNAELSTGPRTDAGKAASSQNAMKFGLTSKQVILPHEDGAEFDAMEGTIINQLNPATDGERLHVDDIIVARWKVRRGELVLKAWIANALKNSPEKDQNLAMAAVMLSPEVRKLQRYIAADRRVADNASKKLDAIQKERREKERRQADILAMAEAMRQLQNEAKLPEPAESSTTSESVTEEARRWFRRNPARR